MMSTGCGSHYENTAYIFSFYRLFTCFLYTLLLHLLIVYVHKDIYFKILVGKSYKTRIQGVF